MNNLKISPSKAEKYGIVIAKDGVFKKANQLLSQKGLISKIRKIWPEITKLFMKIADQMEVAHYMVILSKQNADILAFQRDENLLIPENINYTDLFVFI